MTVNRRLVIRPPSTIVSPLAVLTVVWAVVMLIRGARTTSPEAEIDTGIPSDSGATSDFSASTSITTMPSGLMRGVTPRINPTLSICTVFVWPIWLTITLVINGTFCPTWMNAGWLSIVITCGRLSTSSRWFCCKARSSDVDALAAG